MISDFLENCITSTLHGFSLTKTFTCPEENCALYGLHSIDEEVFTQPPRGELLAWRVLNWLRVSHSERMLHFFPTPSLCLAERSSLVGLGTVHVYQPEPVCDQLVT